MSNTPVPDHGASEIRILEEYFRHLTRPHTACNFIENLLNCGTRDLADEERAALHGHFAACTTCQQRDKALQGIN